MKILKARKRCIPAHMKITADYVECTNCHMLVCYNTTTGVSNSLLFSHFKLCKLTDTRHSWIGKFASGIVTVGGVAYISDWYEGLQG